MEGMLYTIPGYIPFCIPHTLPRPREGMRVWVWGMEHPSCLAEYNKSPSGSLGKSDPEARADVARHQRGGLDPGPRHSSFAATSDGPAARSGLPALSGGFKNDATVSNIEGDRIFHSTKRTRVNTYT